MRKTITGLVLVAGLFLSACAGLSPEASRDAGMASTCQAFSDALGTATTFKPQMSAAQVAAVDQAVDVAQPACHAFRISPDTATETLVNQVRDALRAIVLANQEVSS